MVREGKWMESSERRVLLLQRILEGGHAGGREDPGRRGCVRDRSERGEVGNELMNSRWF
jgi:hypothetical protein